MLLFSNKQHYKSKPVKYKLQYKLFEMKDVWIDDLEMSSGTSDLFATEQISKLFMIIDRFYDW